jgi:hypothetical protein
MKKHYLIMPIILTVLVAWPLMAWAAAPMTFKVHLTGGQEVPLVKTSATGDAIFTLWLYPAGPPPVLKPGKLSGILAVGTITAKNLAGPLKGKPLKSLVDDMEGGRAYVNVHTKAHPEGEIRGQIGVPGKIK